VIVNSECFHPSLMFLAKSGTYSWIMELSGALWNGHIRLGGTCNVIRLPYLTNILNKLEC
jgi:hypothetical protein